MIVRLMHERHGYTHVYDPNSLEFHKAHGWRECDDLVHRGPPADVKPIPNADERAALVALYIAKHGKKPHHKLSIDKLREAVKE